MGKDQSWRSVNAFSKKVKYHQSRKKYKCKFSFGSTACLPTCLKDHAENKGINYNMNTGLKNDHRIPRKEPR